MLSHDHVVCINIDPLFSAEYRTRMLEYYHRDRIFWLDMEALSICLEGQTSSFLIYQVESLLPDTE